MKYVFKLPAFLIIGLLTFAFSSNAAPQTSYIPGTEDIPLMSGLVLENDISDTDSESMVFDTPEGRILSVTASSSHSAESILKFYKTTLPQLGWISLGKGKFQREKEILEMSVLSSQKGKTHILFRLSPQH